MNSCSSHLSHERLTCISLEKKCPYLDGNQASERYQGKLSFQLKITNTASNHSPAGFTLANHYNIESVHPTGHWKAFVLTPIVCPRREIGAQHSAPSGGWFRVPCLQKGWLIHVRWQAYYMRLGVKRKSDTIKVAPTVRIVLYRTLYLTC